MSRALIQLLSVSEPFFFLALGINLSRGSREHWVARRAEYFRGEGIRWLGGDVLRQAPCVLVLLMC